MSWKAMPPQRSRGDAEPEWALLPLGPDTPSWRVDRLGRAWKDKRGTDWAGTGRQRPTRDSGGEKGELWDHPPWLRLWGDPGLEVLGMQPKQETELTPPFQKGDAGETGVGEPPTGGGQISPRGRAIPGERGVTSGTRSSAQGPRAGARRSEGLVDSDLAAEGSPAGPRLWGTVSKGIPAGRELSHRPPGPGERSLSAEAGGGSGAAPGARPGWSCGRRSPSALPASGLPRGRRLGFPEGPARGRRRHVCAARGPVGPQAGEGPRTAQARLGSGPGRGRRLREPEGRTGS